MPGLVRKLLIFTAAEGLVIQAHGSNEHHRAIRINYKTRRIVEDSRTDRKSAKDATCLESHGIIGLITIASFSFLIAITKREQVAQIFGKPVYCITDVALLPLSSQLEANEAIVAAQEVRSGEESTSDSECSEDEGDQRSVTGADFATSPNEEELPYKQKNPSSSSIARDVANRKASYGKFTSEWFSKRVWGDRKNSKQQNQLGKQSDESNAQAKESIQDETTNEAALTNAESREETADKQDVKDTTEVSSYSSTRSLLPKVLRSTKMILSSRSFYFSYEFDLTRRLSLSKGKAEVPTWKRLDPLYFWNQQLGEQILDAGYEAFLLPLIQGFVGQKTFVVKSNSKDCGTENEHEPHNDSEKTFLLTLISRRSTKRSGLRYLRRGIDDEGHCANTAETEQILSSPTWDDETAIRSFVQIRGSIPLYFSQSPYSLKPAPVFHNSASANQAAFKKHFQALRQQYGAVQINMLVDKHGTEATIGDLYEKVYKELQEKEQLPEVNFEWFDFHSECRGMKFENVQRLVDKFKDEIFSWGGTVVSCGEVKRRQQGIIRTNCMDCLDRTNVAQSAFGQHVLQSDIEEEGYSIDLLHDESTNWFNIIWADNGDAISRQYASTAALKGDFTRTRKRNWRGQMNDLGLTLSRYYSNMVNDYFSQAVIDMLLGNVSWKVFEDFESTMMSADPGISVSTAREAAIENCAKIVIQDRDEDLVHGWTLLSPAQENTLRTLPFEEVVVLLTDAAIYCCKFDWNTEKVARFEKVDLRSISKIRHGAYITSTFTERQMNESLNQGLVIVFKPGTGDVIRVNTRSLQNYIAPSSTNSTSVDSGTGLLSWFSAKGTGVARTMALKVLTQEPSVEVESNESSSRQEAPGDVAQRIADEIRRVIEGPEGTGSNIQLVESGDIISAEDAKKRTGYLEQLGHSIKRLVWT